MPAYATASRPTAVVERRTLCKIIITNHFSGPGAAIGPVCSCWCVRTETFELNDLWPIYLVYWFTLTLFTSSSKVKVIGQSSRSQDDKMFFIVYGCALEGNEYIRNRWRAATTRLTKLC